MSQGNETVLVVFASTRGLNLYCLNSEGDTIWKKKVRGFVPVFLGVRSWVLCGSVMLIASSHELLRIDLNNEKTLLEFTQTKKQSFIIVRTSFLFSLAFVNTALQFLQLHREVLLCGAAFRSLSCVRVLR